MARRGRPPGTGRSGATLEMALGIWCRNTLDKLEGKRWPAPKYKDDPALFAKEVLGVTLMPHQIRFLLAIRDGDRVAVRSGQKCGKTFTVCVAALWFVCAFPRARVFVTANTREQITNVIWREIRRLYREAKIDIGGAMHQSPSGGLKFEDGREIVGIQTQQIESLSGLSGLLLFIVDEASALSQAKSEAFEGNTLGGGKLVYISNPTRTVGPFFDAFHEHRLQWRRFHWDSLKVALYIKRLGLKPDGKIADVKYIKRQRRKYNPKSPFWIQRVRGNFLLGDAGKVITVEAVHAAQAAHEDWSATPAVRDTSRLTLGVDWAGEGIGGDLWSFVAVRGKHQLHSRQVEGATIEAALGHIETILNAYRVPGEIPRVTVDIEGRIGAELWGRLKSISEERLSRFRHQAFFVYGVKASAPARRWPQLYDTTRDELWANGRDWILSGGTFAYDPKLEAELTAPGWIEVRRRGVALQKVTPKDDLRSPKMLGRSPDRADGLLLAVWVQDTPETSEDAMHQVTVTTAEPTDEGNAFDPYRSDASRSAFDPYRRHL